MPETIEAIEPFELPESALQEPLFLIAGGAFIRLPPNQDITVLPHVQTFADDVADATGAQSFGTYEGHSPPQGPTRALDIFTPVTSRSLGDAICKFFIANLARYGGRYCIYRQHIWHRLDPVWRLMADLGNVTKNHFDHVHVTFEAESALPAPTPTPAPQGDPRMLTFRYIFNGLDFVFDGPSALYFQLDDIAQITEVLDKLKVPALGEVSDATHRRYKDIAKAAGYAG